MSASASRSPARCCAGPRLLLLDEATSQLDAGNEAALREVVDELAGRTTVLVVAHRLSTVRTAGRIAVLQDGRLRAGARTTSCSRATSSTPSSRRASSWRLTPGRPSWPM